MTTAHFSVGARMMKYAVLLDGGYVRRRLQAHLKRAATADDVEALDSAIRAQAQLDESRVRLRSYFYDASPADQRLTNPVDKSAVNLGDSHVYREGHRLLDALEQKPSFAVRRGQTAVSGWELGRSTLKAIEKGRYEAPFKAKDFVPAIRQKGVDMRIGLDIAWMSLKRTVDLVVLVTGDADFVPAMKLARREGVLVYLEPLGGSTRPELRGHSDAVLATNLDLVFPRSVRPTKPSEGPPGDAEEGSDLDGD